MSSVDASESAYLDSQLPTSLTIVQGDVVVVHLRGEYDCSTVAILSEILASGAALGSAELRIDLSRVEFIDSSTVRVFERAADLLTAESRTLVLRSPCRSLLRTLELCASLRSIRTGVTGNGQPTQSTGATPG